MGTPAIPLARPRPEPEQNPPQSVSGIFTWEEARAYERDHPFQPRVAILEYLQRDESAPINMEESRKATYQRVWADLVNWGYTTQEATDALIRAFASGGVTIAPEPVLETFGEYTAHEVTYALARIFTPEYAAAELASGVDFSLPRYIDSSDGIAPCGYEELL